MTPNFPRTGDRSFKLGFGIIIKQPLERQDLGVFEVVAGDLHAVLLLSFSAQCLNNLTGPIKFLWRFNMDGDSK